MRCPYCNYEESKVIDSRPAEDGSSIRRRRECLSCTKRFTTYEKIEMAPIIVIKRNGTRQFFEREKLKTGIRRACIKRPITAQIIEGIVDEIEMELANSAEKEITTQELGERVLLRLKNIDEVAYIRFASVYKDFKDIKSFLSEIKTLK